MSRAITAGEVEVTSIAVGKWLWREELMAKALELWSPEAINEAHRHLIPTDRGRFIDQKHDGTPVERSSRVESSANQ